MASRFMNDVRYAVRLLGKNPGFTLVVVLSLAFGIGANATVFCWMQSIIFSPVPGAVEQDRLVGLIANNNGGGISWPDSRDFNQLNDVFVGVAASQVSHASLTVDRRTDWTFGQVATANFFDLLGVKPILGRTFLADEDRKPGGNPVLVIGERLWRQRFGADFSVIGRAVELNRHPFTIIGVVPQEFVGNVSGVLCSFWAPISMYNEVGNRKDDLQNRLGRPFLGIARLQPGVTLQQATHAALVHDRRLVREFPHSNRDLHHRVVLYRNVPWGAATVLGPGLQLLMAGTLGVLLIVMANVASLQSARGSSRQKEIAIRMAAGASRLQLIRQLLTENLVLAVLGGVGGIVVAYWGVGLLTISFPSMTIPLAISSMSPDATTLGFTLLLTLSAGLLFGLVPALQISQPRLYAVIKEAGRGTSASRSHHRVRQILVVSEVALSLALLVGAGLCVKGLRRAQKIDVGLNPDRVLVAPMQIGMNGYTEATGKQLYRRLQERISAAPGVESASLASWLPLGLAGCKGHGVWVDGYAPRDGEVLVSEYAVVAPRYFDTLEIPLAAGRDFNYLDDAGSQPVIIVNEHFAQRFWPGRSPIGMKVRTASAERVVIGVARNGKYNRLNEPAWPFFYLPYQQYVPDLDLGVVVRTKGDPAAFAPVLRKTVSDLDPALSLLGTTRMTDHVSATLFVQRMATSLLSGLGVVALLLAAMGVYAVTAYAVNQRTQEFGIRMALGAQPRIILGSVLGRGAWMMLLGIGAGLVLSLTGAPLLSGFLFGVSPFDLATFIGVALLLGAAAMLASYLPARRATQIDPIAALRNE